MIIDNKHDVIETFHASPVLFDSFLRNDDGIHFGPLESCLKAVAYKEPKEAYLYHVIIHSGRLIGECKDSGKVWYNLKQKFNTGVNVFRYINKYEIADDFSYVIINPQIVDIIAISPIDSNILSRYTTHLLNNDSKKGEAI